MLDVTFKFFAPWLIINK